MPPLAASRVCTLCGGTVQLLVEGRNGRYFACDVCGGIGLDEASHLSWQAERTHYETHNNDVHDTRYQAFVQPIVQAVQVDYPPGSRGLDFGCGTGPVITYLLRQAGYEMALFDPFFVPEASVLAQHYDFIVCCEVIEHFRQPADEFRLLNRCLAPEGALYCMTEVVPEGVPFEQWYYTNDPTHVFLYREETLQWLAATYSWTLRRAGRFSSFQRR